mgnify:CR=1 FL=1
MGEMTVKFHVDVPVCVKQEGRWYLAACLPLDIYSQGTTEDEAVKNLTEALQLFVESCFERGTLEQALKELGFKTSRRSGAPHDGDRVLSVPLPLLARNAEARAC